MSNPANAPRQIRLSELSHLLTLINMGSDAARRCLALSQEHSREAAGSGLQIVPAAVLNGQAPPADVRHEHRRAAAQLLGQAQAEVGAMFGYVNRLAAELQGSGEVAADLGSISGEARPSGPRLVMDEDPVTSSPK